MTARVPVRGGSHLRRGRGVRRASARASFTRWAATLVLLLVGTTVYLLMSGPVFSVGGIDVRGDRYADRAAVTEALLAGGGSLNLFRYDTFAAAARLEKLPAVRRADVHAVLPDRLVADLDERAPVLIWVVGAQPFLVDAEGILFAVADGEGATLPLVTDLRQADAGLALGNRLDPVDLRVARQLTAVTPRLLGSAAAALTVQVTDAEGYVLSTAPPRWTAVFGVYGSVVRSAELVPVQVQCLGSLLASRGEAKVRHVVLSPEGQLCGTFTPP